MKNALQLLRERLDTEKPFTDVEAIVKAFEAQGCAVQYPRDSRYKEYEVTTSLGNLKLLITLWPREPSGYTHFTIYATVDESPVENVEFSVDGDKRFTDQFGITLGPCLPVKEHGKVTIERDGYKKELTW